MLLLISFYRVQRTISYQLSRLRFIILSDTWHCLLDHWPKSPGWGSMKACSLFFLEWLQCVKNAKKYRYQRSSLASLHSIPTFFEKISLETAPCFCCDDAPSNIPREATSERHAKFEHTHVRGHRPYKVSHSHIHFFPSISFCALLHSFAVFPQKVLLLGPQRKKSSKISKGRSLTRCSLLTFLSTIILRL